MSEDKIRELAYLNWEKAGYPQSDGVKFWLQAEEVLSASPKKTSQSSSGMAKVAAKATKRK